jgi:hypothetical protein|tara:strand:- start:3145 stop:4632 length:1488 start_codon:yes stop_codon:yes gene_type:complete
MPWSPQIGSQLDFIDLRQCVPEAIIAGDRGGGKSAVLIADAALAKIEQGEYFKGILFRRHLGEFETLLERSKEVFYGYFPDGEAKYLAGDQRWVFKDGSSLQFAMMEHDTDVDKHLGLEYTWIGFDELPQWPRPRPYLMMLASLRTARKGVFVRVRSTGNPGGSGIGWIKKRFSIPDSPVDCAEASGKLVEDTETGLNRVFIYSRLIENKILLQADPFYQQRLAASVEGDPELRKAWIDADFSALFGQYFKVFDSERHCVDPYDLWPDGLVPYNWRILGSLDYGENSPTSFGLWAISPEGLNVRMAEYYKGGEFAGYHAGAIKDLCAGNPYTQGRMPQVVWADSALWSTRSNQGGAVLNRTVADIFKNEAGLKLRPSMKGPNSRVIGWRYMKEMLAQDKLVYFEDCHDFEDEMKNAQFSDKGDREDIDKNNPDHALDETRYLLMASRRGTKPPPPPEASYATWGRLKQKQKGKLKGSFMTPPRQKVDLEELANSF